jgi:hypothetical protein
MTKFDLYLSAASQIPEICAYWKIRAPKLNPFTISKTRYGSGGKLFGYYQNNEIWVNVEDSSKPVRFEGRARSYPGNKIDRTASGILFHELGHHVQSSKRMDAPLWRSILKTAKDEAISGYEPVPSEAFAETMRVFSSNPDLLRLGAPRRYAFICQYIQPWHSSTWREALEGAPDFIIQGAMKWAWL